MAVVIVLVLLALWAAVLVPPIMRARGRGAESAASGVSGIVADLKATVFAGRRRSHAPSALPTLMGPVGATRADIPEGPMPTNMSPQQRRRRDVFVTLLGAVGATLILAVLTSSVALWLIQLVTDGLLAAYVVLLLRFKAERQQSSRRSANPHPVSPLPNYAPLPSNVRSLNRKAAPQFGSIARGSTVIAFPRSAAR